MFMSFVITFIGPIFFSRVGDGKNLEKIGNLDIMSSRIVKIGLVITVLITLATAILHKYIFIILTGGEYQVVSVYLPILVFSGGIFGVAQIIAVKYFSLMSTKELLPASIVSSLVGIASAFVGVFYYGLLGAIIASLVHSLSYLFLVSKLNVTLPR